MSPTRKHSRMRRSTINRFRIRQKLSRRIVAGAIGGLIAFICVLLYSNLFDSSNAYASTNYTWKGLTDSSWSNPSNWAPAGVPGVVDNVIIGNVATNNPVLDDSVSINNLTINNGGVLDLKHFQLSTLGTLTINNGAQVNVTDGLLLANGNASFNGGLFIDSTGAGAVVAQGTTVTFGQGANGPVFNTNLKVNAATVRLANTIVNGNTIINKTGSSNDQSAGNNTFNGVTNITTNTTGYFLMSASTRDIFNADVTFSSLGSGIIYPAYNGAGTEFNGNIIVNSTSTGGVRIGANTGTSALAAGKTISLGNQDFSGGMLMLGRMNFVDPGPLNISLPPAVTLTIGPGSVFNTEVNVECGGLCLSGATFNAKSTFVKSGTSNDRGTGGNIFNDSTSIINKGSGYLLMSNNTADIFNAPVIFNCSNTGIIYPAYNGTGNQFNENIILNSTGSGGIRIGANTGSSVLANTKRLLIGADGFSNGPLVLGNFSSGDTIAQVFSLSGSSILTLGPASSFAGPVSVESGGICLNGVTFNSTASFIKNGSTNDQGIGNNVFNAPVSFTNNGTGYLLMSNTNNDIYNADVTFTCNGNGIIYPAYRGTKTQFNGNVIVNSSGTGGVRIGASTGSSEIADGKRILVGPDGFSSGILMLGNFTSVDTAAQTISLSGSAVLSLGPSTSFAGEFTGEAGGIILSGANFASKASFIKNGATNDQGTGNNIFNSTASFTNNGTGYFLMSNTTRDIYNGDVVFNASNSGIIYAAYKGSNTEFNGDVIVNSSGTGGVRIGASTGTSVLASSKKILTGASGFSNGMLMLSNFTSPGTDEQNINLSGNGVLTLGPSSSFAGAVNAQCGGICLSGVNIDGNANFIKTGTSNDQGTGNNVFNGSTNITNSGSGYILLSSSKKDVFHKDVNFSITNSGIIYVSYAGIGNEFNDQVTISSSGSGSIRFGSSTGTSVLADGKKISIGAGGFSGGYVQLAKFTQVGNTSQSMNVNSGTAAIYLNAGTTFNGPVDFRFPQVYLNGTVFNNTVFIEKNGATNNAGTGANVFNGIATIKNSGSGILYLANTSGDDFNDHVNFIQTGTGALRPANNNTSTFAKNISTAGSNAVITLAASNGTVAFDGSQLQNIDGDISFPPVIRRLTMANGNNGLKLNVPLTVNAALTLMNGVIYSSATNLLTVDNGVSSVANVSDASYVDGPVRKIGNQSFTFPVGRNGHYRPISISAPSTATSQFTAEYFQKDPALLYSVLSMVLTIKQVSRCEYWSLQRNNGVSNVNISLSWDVNTCAAGSSTDLRVSAWDGLLSIWKDLGNGGVTGNATSGTLITNSPVTSYGTFTLGTTNPVSALPVELVSFDAKLNGDKVSIDWKTASEINNDFFTVERSSDGEYFEPIAKIGGNGNTTNMSVYHAMDDYPLEGTSYYRLRQTDYDGKFEIFDPVSVNFKGLNAEFQLKNVGPNPFSSTIRLDYFSPENTELILMLNGLDGSMAFTDRISVYQGAGSYTTGQLPELSPGIYILKLLKGEAVLETRKLVKN